MLQKDIEFLLCGGVKETTSGLIAEHLRNMKCEKCTDHEDRLLVFVSEVF